MRMKKFTLVGFAADDNGLAVSQALLANTAADPNAFAVSQALDVAADTDNIALSQNPNNAASTNAFALAQTYTASVALTLEAAASSIVPKRRASFTSATNQSGTNFTIVGTGVDSAGAAVTGEVVAGPNANTVNSLNAYSAITSITPDATSGANTVSVGYPAYLDATLTLEALAASLIPPRQISLTSGAAANFGSVEFTVIGTDENGDAASEALFGPNNNTVSTAGFFGSVTSITLNPTDASVDATMTAGYLANSVPQQLTFNGVLGNGLGNLSDTFSSTKVTLISADNLSALTFAIVGLGSNGLPQSEVLAGPNAATATSLNEYTRVDSIMPSDDSAGSVEAGIAAASGIADLLLEPAANNLSPAREIEIDASADISSIKFTVVGLDRKGYEQTEVITGVTTTAVRSAKLWSKVTSITPDAANANTVIVGWSARTPTPWVPCGIRYGLEILPAATANLLVVTGAADGIVEVTYDRPSEGKPTVDESIAITPGTPVQAQGMMCRVVLTSGAATTGEARIAQPGP